MDTPDDISLHSAVQSNDIETAELILSEKNDIYHKNEQGLTPLDVLIQKKIELFDILREKENKDFPHFTSELTNEKDSNYASIFSYHLRMDQQRRDKLKKEMKDVLNTIYHNDRFIDMLLRHKSINHSCPEDVIMLKLHAACTLTNSSIADLLSNEVGSVELSQFIRKNAPIYSGYTALHFAAYCNANTVKMLVMKGANLMTKDINGVTPLDICIESFKVEEMLSILSLVSEWRNILFSDGKTKLMDYIASLQNPVDHTIFLQNIDKGIELSLSKNSPLWPGYTILHVAVSLLRESNYKMFENILNRSTNIVTMQDIHGSTPIHLAFRKNKSRFVDLLVKRHKKAVNPVDIDDLSHLHIAVAVNRTPLVKNILKSEGNCNLAYKGKPLPTVKLGWTPLHTATYTNHAIVAKLLLERGANLLQTDSQGFTAVHLLVNPNITSKITQVLFASNQLKEYPVEGIGLTHLHVAVWKNDTRVIERLINSGSDIEATIGKVEDKHLKKFEGFRPIYMAMIDYRRISAFSILLLRGADIFGKRPNGPSPLEELLIGKYNEELLKAFVQFLWSKEELQNRIKREYGITLLHLACYVFDKKKVEELLERKVDANAKIRDDSSIWSGFTALHVVYFAGLSLEHERLAQLNVDRLCNILLEHGADVTLADATGDTPLLMAVKTRHASIGRIRTNLLISHQRNFDVNPTNESGMSHFHVACLLCKVQTVQNFFKNINNINVNQAISLSYNGKFAGQTPLMLALSKWSRDPESQIKVVNLLLERGADVHTVDAFGYTPLHKLCSCTLTRKNLLDKILIDNTDINKRARDGKTPLEILLRFGASSQEVQHFIERGAVINNYNPVSDVGYMALVINSVEYTYISCFEGILKMMMDLPDICEVSDTGRNAIHNAVSAEGLCHTNYFCSSSIQHLMKLGCNIFQQDSQGRTALHLAVKFQNESAVLGLLNCGADVNIVDSSGKSPFSYASEYRKNQSRYITRDFYVSVCKILAIHVKKLQLVGLQVSKQNVDILKTVMNKTTDIDVKSLERVINQRLQDAAKIKMCQRGFTARDFLYQTGFVNCYLSLNRANRDDIISFFDSRYPNDLFELRGFLNLQYIHFRERPSLIASAKDGLRRLLGFHLPDLCADIVLMYLTNFDIKNMTKATADDANMAID